MIKKYKLVVVHWDDHWGSPDDISIGDVNMLLRPAVQRTVGWVVAKNRKRIAIASWIDQNGGVGHTVSILRSCIWIIKYLEEGDTRCG